MEEKIRPFHILRNIKLPSFPHIQPKLTRQHQPNQFARPQSKTYKKKTATPITLSSLKLTQYCQKKAFPRNSELGRKPKNHKNKYLQTIHNTQTPNNTNPLLRTRTSSLHQCTPPTKNKLPTFDKQKKKKEARNSGLQQRQGIMLTYLWCR